MQRITLANTGITISRIGFGCASLTAHNDRTKAISILNTALDAGVTHFDTARLYGMGHSESILGDFIRDKRDRVTITTKFGMESKPSALTGNRQLVGMVKSVIRKSSLLNKLVRRGMKGSGPATGKFTPEDARQSLETSLRELNTSHVDFFMLHCCTLEQAQREDLIAYLESCVKAGTVRAFGPSTEFAKLNNDLKPFPAAHKLFQFESNAATRNVERLSGADSRDIITFAPIFAAKGLAAAAARKAQIAPLAARADVDPTNPDALAGFMLADALARNPRGGVLFATTSAPRVTANINAAKVERTPDARAAFSEMLTVLLPHVQTA